MRNQYDNIEFDQSETVKRELHPSGIAHAACVDIVDMPHIQNKFYDPKNPKSKEFTDQLKLVFETEAVKENGTPFTISLFCTRSLYSGFTESGEAVGVESKLHKILVSWLSSDFDGRFAASKLYGRAALLVISHKTSGKGTIKAVIATVLPESGKPYVPSGNYRRWVDKSQGFTADSPEPTEPPAEDDDVPF